MNMSFLLQDQPKKYLPVYRCCQNALEMSYLLFVDDFTNISHIFRKNYKYLIDFLTKTSEGIVGLSTYAPQLCDELVTLECCLILFCRELHSAFV